MWQTGHVLARGESAAALGANVSLLLKANLLRPHPRSGAFLDSCSHHCGMWGDIRIEGQLVADAFSEWYEGQAAGPPKRFWQQGRPYPCRECCRPNDAPSRPAGHATI